MKRRNRKSRLTFSPMEQRQLLATLFLGTDGVDTASIEYAGENLVDIRINDTFHEDVDSSDGIRINLGRSGSTDFPIINDLDSAPITDTIKIDHRITDSVFVHNANRVVIDGGDNVVHAFTDPDIPVVGTVDGIPFTLAGPTRQMGTINDNIVFTGTVQIATGDGQDTFNLAITQGSLAVEGGGGDDLFRFAEDIDGVFGGTTSDFAFPSATVAAYGNDGNDRFAYLPGNLAGVQIIGGDGADVADYRFSEGGVSASFFGGEGIHTLNSLTNWREIETFMGAAGQDNLIGLISESRETRFDWTVDGDITTIHNRLTGATTEVHNFNQFRSSSVSLDWFHVKETARDIEIIDGDQIRIASEFNMTQGDLSGIKHNISIVRAGSYIIDPPLGVNTFEVILAIDSDGITTNPDVFISGMAGAGITATLESNQTIRLRDGGSIRFVDDPQTTFISALDAEPDEPLPFQPNIELHGSETEGDFFLVKETWTPTTIYSHDGDDTFFVGSSNRNANGNLALIAEELTIGAGRGTDRVYINNQSYDDGDARYQLTDTSLVFIEVETADDDVDRIITNKINFNSAVEVVRVNGSNTQQNSFTVVKSTATKMIIAGSSSPDIEDRASFRFNGAIDPLPTITFSEDDPKGGSVTSSRDGLGTVFFAELEVTNLLDPTDPLLLF